MPFAVTHMLIPMILLDFLRDNVLKIRRNKLTNKYILIAGIAGLIPDVDIPLSLVFGSTFVTHRAITHTVWLPLTFLLFSSVFYFFKKHQLSLIFLMGLIGTSIHIILDFATAGSIPLLYPLSETPFGLNLIPLNSAFFSYAALDAVILGLYFIKLSFRKRIPDAV